MEPIQLGFTRPRWVLQLLLRRPAGFIVSRVHFRTPKCHFLFRILAPKRASQIFPASVCATGKHRPPVRYCGGQIAKRIHLEMGNWNLIVFNSKDFLRSCGTRPPGPGFSDIVFPTLGIQSGGLVDRMGLSRRNLGNPPFEFRSIGLHFGFRMRKWTS